MMTSSDSTCVYPCMCDSVCGITTWLINIPMTKTTSVGEEGGWEAKSDVNNETNNWSRSGDPVFVVQVDVLMIRIESLKRPKSEM